MNNNLNNCCCNISIKSALCILKSMNSLFSTKTFYSHGSSIGTIEKSLYPNIILLKEINGPTTTNISLCIENINYIEINPKMGMYQYIIYELDKEYSSPFCIDIPNDKNFCCK